MIGHWIVFGLIILAIAPGWIGLYKYVTKNRKLTGEEKTVFGKNIIIGSLFIILVDCFYMTCFNRWDTACYVLGGLLTLVVFYNLWNAFVSFKKRSFLEKWSSLLDFLVGIGVSVYLIYIVPDSTLQTILTAIVAAIFGGMLTLAGVVLTIRWTKRQGEDDRKKAIRPFFYFTANAKGHSGNGTLKTKFFNGFSTEFGINLGFYENSDKIEFVLEKIVYLGKEYQCIAEPVVAKGEIFEIFLSLSAQEDVQHPKSFELIVSDVDGALRKLDIATEWREYTPLIKTIKYLED